MKNPFKFEDKTTWINVGLYSGVAIIAIIIVTTVIVQIISP